MRQVNVHDAKTELSKLLELAEAGERIVIARAGRPVAVLTAYRAAARRRRLGLFRGHGSVSTDFDALPEDVLRAFEGQDE